MRVSSRNLTGDPARSAGLCGDAAVETLAQLQPDPGPAMASVVEVGGQLLLYGLCANTHIHLNPRLAQEPEPRAAHMLVRILQGDHHAPHTRLDEGLGTGWSPAVMGAGLEGAIDRAAARLIAGGAQGVGFGVGAAQLLVIPFAEDASIGGDHDSANHRIGTHVSAPAAGQPQGAPHVGGICDFGHGWISTRI